MEFVRGVAHSAADLPGESQRSSQIQFGGANPSAEVYAVLDIARDVFEKEARPLLDLTCAVRPDNVRVLAQLNPS